MFLRYLNGEMFENLLNGIFDRNRLSDTKSKEQYLSELRPYMKQLWTSYKTGEVKVDYSESKIQEAYLLRYFPFYTFPLETELYVLGRDGITLPEVELLDACFFGCGPGPEVIGLMRHLVKQGPTLTTMLTAKMVDIAAATWSHSREIVRDVLAEPYWENWGTCLVEYESFAASLSDTQALKQIELEGCHLAVVQNCLNEVPYKDREKVACNIMDVFNRLPPGAVALVIDRARYDSTTEMMKKMQRLADGNERLRSIGDPTVEKEINCGNLLDDVPSIITDNVLYRSRGHIPDKWNGLTFMGSVKFISIAFQVEPIPATNKDRL